MKKRLILSQLKIMVIKKIQQPYETPTVFDRLFWILHYIS